MHQMAYSWHFAVSIAVAYVFDLRRTQGICGLYACMVAILLHRLSLSSVHWWCVKLHGAFGT